MKFVLRAGLIKTEVEVTDKWLTIKRKGMANFFLYQGMKGTKKIRIKSISGIQYKEANNLTNGYIQIILQGSEEGRGGYWEASKDENSIIFDIGSQRIADNFVDYLEEQMD